MAYTLYTIMTASINVGSEKKVSGTCRRRKKPMGGENKDLRRQDTKQDFWIGLSILLVQQVFLK